MRLAAKVDSTQAPIMAALRQLGWLVIPTHRLPGFVDAVAYRPRDGVRLLEFKTPKGRLTKSQLALVTDEWPIQFLRSVDDAVNLR